MSLNIIVKFKEFVKRYNKLQKKQKLPQAANVHKDSSNMSPTQTLPAATGGNQPRLS
jgi:hypothetical protein